MREIRAQYDVLLSRGLPVNEMMMSWAKEYLRLMGKVSGRDFVNQEVLSAMPYTGFPSRMRYWIASSRMRDRITLLLREERGRRFDSIPLIDPHPLPVRMDGVVGDYANEMD